jgi:hypothetical protein
MCRSFFSKQMLMIGAHTPHKAPNIQGAQNLLIGIKAKGDLSACN